MGTIRERDDVALALLAGHPDEKFLCATAIDDRHALLFAGDMLVEAIVTSMTFDTAASDRMLAAAVAKWIAATG